jgi:hypothetical protein
MEKYRIIRWERYDKKGEMIVSKFFIQKRIKFWKFGYWKYVRTQTGYSFKEGKYPERVSFKFLTEAQHFIEDILINNKPFDRELTQVVQTY